MAPNHYMKSLVSPNVHVKGTKYINQYTFDMKQPGGTPRYKQKTKPLDLRHFNPQRLDSSLPRNWNLRSFWNMIFLLQGGGGF